MTGVQTCALPIFMPQAMEQMLDLLMVSHEHRTFDFIGEGHALAPGAALPKPEGVFPRFVEAEAGEGK